MKNTVGHFQVFFKLECLKKNKCLSIAYRVTTQNYLEGFIYFIIYEYNLWLLI